MGTRGECGRVTCGVVDRRGAVYDGNVISVRHRP